MRDMSLYLADGRSGLHPPQGRPAGAVGFSPAAGGGFSLVELMLALVILGIGMVAVASIFPVAARMQGNTYDDMMAKEMAVEISALLMSRKITAKSLEDDGITSLVQPISAFPTLANLYTEIDRSFPSTMPATRDRRYYWQIFFRKQPLAAGKSIICHYPPGSPANKHTLIIDDSAWPAHSMLHGDTLGPCGGYDYRLEIYEVYVTILRRERALPAGDTFPTVGTTSADTLAYEPALQDSGNVLLPTADFTPATGVWNGGPNAKVLLVLRFSNEVIQ